MSQVELGDVRWLERWQRSWRDRLFAVLAAVATFVLLVPLLLLVGGLLLEGGTHLRWDFLWTDPVAGGASGGIRPVLVSTALVMLVALAAAVPLGLATALFLSESLLATGSAARRTGFTLDCLAAVPSIVYGLFGYQLFAITFGLGFSILTGGLTLACMILPLFVRSAEQSLRLCPTSYRSASAALGISRPGFIRRILLPQAMPGIAAGLVLSLGRALAETAVLLFTAGYVLRMPGSLADSGRVLSVHIYDLAMNVPNGMPAAAAAALVLTALLLVLNLLLRVLAGRLRGMA